MGGITGSFVNSARDFGFIIVHYAFARNRHAGVILSVPPFLNFIEKRERFDILFRQFRLILH